MHPGSAAHQPHAGGPGAHSTLLACRASPGCMSAAAVQGLTWVYDSCDISRISAPAANALLPEPVSTMAFTEGSSSSAAAADVTSCITCEHHHHSYCCTQARGLFVAPRQKNQPGPRRAHFTCRGMTRRHLAWLVSSRTLVDKAFSALGLFSVKRA